MKKELIRLLGGVPASDHAQAVKAAEEERDRQTSPDVLLRLYDDGELVWEGLPRCTWDTFAPSPGGSLGLSIRATTPPITVRVTSAELDLYDAEGMTRFAWDFEQTYKTLSGTFSVDQAVSLEVEHIAGKNRIERFPSARPAR